MARRFITWFQAVGLTLLVASAALAQQSRGLKQNLALGNPSHATSDAKENPDNFLMDKDLFALSYNSGTGTPNWVSWRLVKDDFGDIERKDAFHADDSLPPPLIKVRPADYDHSGFDQGHMCPNGDRDVDPPSAKQTFVMTNMVPQSPALNRQSWRLLEDHCQKLAGSGKELHIVAGPFGSGGHGLVEKKKVEGNEKSKVTKTNVFKTVIGKDEQITVPVQCWKVVLILDAGPGDPAQRVTKNTEVIAVIMANDMTAKKWQEHQVSVADVEAVTKHKIEFFTKVPVPIRDALRKRPPAQARRFDPAAPLFARSFGDFFVLAGPDRLLCLR